MVKSCPCCGIRNYNHEKYCTSCGIKFDLENKKSLKKQRKIKRKSNVNKTQINKKIFRKQSGVNYHSNRLFLFTLITVIILFISIFVIFSKFL
jgi:uncharacterized membrane protein YvbJ